MKKSRATALDRTDFRLLVALQADARISHVALAEKVALSPSATARRIRALETGGVIRGYRAELDPAAFGLVTTVIIRITLERQSEESLAAFEKAVARIPDVLSCHLMSGSDDYLVLVQARDIEDFERIHTRHLSRLPGVARLHSSFALRQVIRRNIPETAIGR
jgi:DNA-binding Lrp family transcriptional regulator